MYVVPCGCDSVNFFALSARSERRGWLSAPEVHAIYSALFTGMYEQIFADSLVCCWPVANR